MNPALYEFVNFSHQNQQVDVPTDDLIEQKVFKWKYRQFAYDAEEYELRQDRMVERFFQRVQTRDPAVEIDLGEVL